MWAYALKGDDGAAPTSLIGRVVSVELRGDGHFDNVTLSSSAPHRRLFLRAADWFVRHQVRTD